MTTKGRGSPRRMSAAARHEDAAPQREVATPTRGRRALKHAGRGARFFAVATIPFIALLVLGLALTYVKLKHGPISLSFLVTPIERSINAALSGYVAEIDDAIVQLTDSNRLEFRLQNIRFAEPDGDVVASAPLAAIEMSRHALYQGRLVPSRVELIQPELFLTYSSSKGLSVSFSETKATSAEDGADTTSRTGRVARSPEASTGDGATLFKTLDFGQLLKRASSEARRTQGAASFLREFGMRDATLHVDHLGQRTVWQMPEVGIDFDQRDHGSVVSGRARIASGKGSWRVAFHTEDDAGNLTLRASIRDFVPTSLFDSKSGGSMMSLMDLPLGANVTVPFAASGEARVAEIDIEIGRGNIYFRDGHGHLNPIAIEAGRIKSSYDPAAGTLVIAPSTIKAGDATLTFEAAARRGPVEGGEGWRYELHGLSGIIGSGQFMVQPVPLESLVIKGRYVAAAEELFVESGEMRAGGAAMTATAAISLKADQPGIKMESTTSPMDLPTLKAVWPTSIAPKSRMWVGENVLSGRVERLSFRRESGRYTPPDKAPGSNHASLSIQTGAGSFRPDNKLPPVEVARALITLDDDNLEIAAPDAQMKLPSGKVVMFKGGRLVSNDAHAEPSHAEVSFRAQADAVAAIEFLRQGSFAAVGGDLPLKNLDGKVDSQLVMTFPMAKKLTASQIKVTGKAKVTDGRVQKLFGDYDVQGASVAFDFNNGAVEAKGEAIVRGVLARISWQHIFDAPEDRQPPLRITATLDNADRKQLGLDVSQFILGDVPVDLQVVRGTGAGASKVHVRADLSNAEVNLAPISWRKPPGRNAFAEFDIAAVSQNRHELQNFRVAGDNIAIEGWVALGENQKLSEFYFPDFSLNVVTRLKVQGKLGKDDIWDIKARGSTFDGKDFFRSLFTIGRTDGTQGDGQNSRGGVDLDAEIDNVLGLSETSLRGLKVKLQNRGGRMTALDARGKLDSGEPMAVVLERDGNGHRLIRADSTDAGQAFKLVGFYPNMQKGRVRLEVNVDGRGAAEKTGTLWVEDFLVLGDPIVSEVVSSSGYDDGRPSIGGRQRVTREVFEFNTMRVPFSIGHGQFVLDDAYMKGPLLGATIRGKVDFKTSKVNLGGTYIPLQGLNNAFGQIPVLGQILSGPRGEGIFGITFAVQGAMPSPQVIVNPLSLVAPGIFREVFQMTNPSPKVQPRKSETPRIRRSIGSSRGPSVSNGTGSSVSGTTIDGWSSDTRPR